MARDKVFVSYAQGDETFEHAKPMLREAGLECWTDRDEIRVSDELRASIRRGISQCKACLFLLSADSARSEWCQAEVAAFWGAGKPVVVYCEDRQTPKPTILEDTVTTYSLKEAVDTVARRVKALWYPEIHNAWRITRDNHARNERTLELANEHKQKHGPLRLLASSGESYLKPDGNAWKDGGIHKLVYHDKVPFHVLLASPLSEFARTRMAANHTTKDHWIEKITPQRLEHLLGQEGFHMKVTSHPINCSLFFVGGSVLYDPYLWALPGEGLRTENHFWVWEFRKEKQKPTSTRVSQNIPSSFELLERHYDFLWKDAEPMKDFLGRYRQILAGDPS